MAASVSAGTGLVADIGGTNARFALCHPGGEAHGGCSLPCADFPGPVEAAKAYLAGMQPEPRPTVGAFAVASPIAGDVITMTNHPWQFSVTRIRQELGLDRLEVINDFEAVARCVPRLTPGHRLQVGEGAPVVNTPIAVLGAGTGLGVALLMPEGGRWRAVPTEGGHVTMAAADERESTILALLRRRFGHVSAERILSGPGLINLHAALAKAKGTACDLSLEPAIVTEHALAGTDASCVETVHMFLAMLGAIAGNLALTTGARGGVYIAGGIVPRLITMVPASSFRTRFEDKGRFRAYNAQVPTYVITHPYPAFLGLSALLDES